MISWRSCWRNWINVIDSQSRSTFPQMPDSTKPLPESVLKICIVLDQWKWFKSCKQLGLLCLANPRNLPNNPLFSWFQSYRELWNPRSWKVNVFLIWINDLYTFEITLKLKINLYVAPVSIFPNFWHSSAVTMYFDLNFFPDFYDMKVFSFNYFRWLYFPG